MARSVAGSPLTNLSSGRLPLPSLSIFLARDKLLFVCPTVRNHTSPLPRKTKQDASKTRRGRLSERICTCVHEWGKRTAALYCDVYTSFLKNEARCKQLKESAASPQGVYLIVHDQGETQAWRRNAPHILRFYSVSFLANKTSISLSRATLPPPNTVTYWGSSPTW